MNKKLKFTIIPLIIIISVILFLNLYTERGLKYSIGKDTIHYFGDGTFQIIKSPSGEKVLYKLPEQAVVESDVYKHKEINDKIYVMGKLGYTIINMQTNQIQQFRDFNDYNEVDIKSMDFMLDSKELENGR